MSESSESDLAAPPTSPAGPIGRRRMLRGVAGGALAIGGAVALAGCTGSSNDATASGSGPTESLIQRVQKSGKLAVGVNLGTKPLQYLDPTTNEPTGYVIELLNLMAVDMNVKLEYVQQPFANLFTGLAANRFDMSGISASMLPSRAFKVLFASYPVYIETEVMLLKQDSKMSSVKDLDDPNVTIAVRLGSSQATAAAILLPKAKFKQLNELTALLEDVASGRSDAALVGDFAAATAIQANPKLKVLPGGPLYIDYNTFFLPYNDLETKAWVDNWLTFNIAHGTLEGLWTKWVSPITEPVNMKTLPVTSPYLYLSSGAN